MGMGLNNKLNIIFFKGYYFDRNLFFIKVIAISFFLLTTSFSYSQPLKSIDAAEKIDNPSILSKNIKDSLMPIWNNNRILVTVMIQGKSYLFVFDTGAGITVISKELQRELNLKTSDSSLIVNDALLRKSLTHTYIIDSLFLNNTPLTNISTITANLSSFSNMACQKIDGILGFNAMENLIWDINVSNKHIAAFN